MKRLTSIFLIISSILLSSCSATYNSREDVSHLLESELKEYVEERVFENISLADNSVRVADTENAERLEYTFHIESRGIPFKVFSMISAPHASLVGSGAQLWQTGDYRLKITIDYYEAIFDHYREDRKKLAEKLNIDADDFNSISIENYDDINKAAGFIVELDRLYSYESSLVARNWHLYERIYFNEFEYDEYTKLWIEPVSLSTDKKNRLVYDDVYEQIVRVYISQLKKWNFTDATIPEDIFNKYEEIFDE